VVAIYGANASGKSNLIHALGYLRDMVVNSDRKAEPGLGVTRTPFRLDPEVARSPSSFDFDAVIDGTHYSYGFVVDDDAVVEEWLYRYPKKRRQVVFAREGSSYRYGTTTSADLREAEGITAENVLFMSVAARAGKSEVVPVYRWMRAMQLPSPPMSHLPARGGLLSARLVQAAEDADRHRVVLGLLRAADLGVEEFGVTESGETGPRGEWPFNIVVEQEGKDGFNLISRSRGEGPRRRRQPALPAVRLQAARYREHGTAVSRRKLPGGAVHRRGRAAGRRRTVRTAGRVRRCVSGSPEPAAPSPASRERARRRAGC
jgi:hypothetical protein